MLAICSATEPVVFKATKTSSNAERVPHGTKPGAKPGHKKHSTSSKQPFVSIKEATKGGSSKVPTSSKIGHSKKRKESSSAIDSNLSQPPVFTLVDTGMHKEDQQATGSPTSLGVTSKATTNPQLSSGMSTFYLNKPIYSASFIIQSESASGNDASAVSIVEVDLVNSAPSDFVPQQQGINKGTKNTSYDHLFAGKGVSSIARQVEEEEASSTIKLEDLEKLVSNMQPSFKDLDSPGDDPVIIVDDSDKDEEDEVHPTTNAETEDTSVPKSSSPRYSQIQELTNQVLTLQSQKHKLERKKTKAKAKAALLKAQPSFPNVRQLNELLVKSLQTEFSKILSAHDFSSSLPTELKDLPSKFNELTKEVKGLKKQVHELEIKLPGELKGNPTKLEDFTKTVTSLTSQVTELKTLQWELPAEFISLPELVASVQAKLKTLDALPSLLLNVTKALNKFAQVLDSTNLEAGYPSVSLADKGKKAMSSEEAEKDSTNSDSNDDDKTHVTGFMVESSKTKKLKKFDFITEYGTHIYLTEEEINHQKKLEEDAKAEAAKQEGEIRKAKLVDQLGPEVVNILHDLANKKRKHTDDIHDFFRANKRLKSSVQYKDHPAGTVLNEPVLEIFFKLHQGPRLDDHARTFSSLLLAEIDKRNLNTLKQMRVIEQLRQYNVSCTHVLRRLRSIFTSVYAAVQKLKKKVCKAGKRFLDVKRNKAISLGKGKVYKAGKSFYVKRNKAISWEKVLLKLV
ncbi:hypothetical protein Tco_0664085 [Tanacetum coccineum]